MSKQNIDSFISLPTDFGYAEIEHQIFHFATTNRFWLRQNL